MHTSPPHTSLIKNKARSFFFFYKNFYHMWCSLKQSRGRGESHSSVLTSSLCSRHTKDPYRKPADYPGEGYTTQSTINNKAGWSVINFPPSNSLFLARISCGGGIFLCFCDFVANFPSTTPLNQRTRKRTWKTVQ